MASNISVYKGVTYPFNYTHLDTAGEPVDITDYTLYFTVKSEEYDTDADDSTALISKTVTSHTDAANGETGFTLNDEDTNITPGKYYYTILMEDGDGLSEPPSLIGRFVVLSQQTNRQVGNE